MSSLLPNTTTATELQRNYRNVVRIAKKAKKPITVLSNNKPDAIYMDYEAFIKEYLTKRVSKDAKSRRGEGIMRAFGSMTGEEADKLDRIIEEECERIDPEGWK